MHSHILPGAKSRAAEFSESGVNIAKGILLSEAIEYCYIHVSTTVND